MFGRVGHSGVNGGGVSRAQVANVARDVLQTSFFDEQVNEVLATATFEGATYVADHEPTGNVVGGVYLATDGTQVANPTTVGGESGEQGTAQVLADTKYAYVTAHNSNATIVTPVRPTAFWQYLGAPFNFWHETSSGEFSVTESSGEFHTEWTGLARIADVRLEF